MFIKVLLIFNRMMTIFFSSKERKEVKKMALVNRYSVSWGIQGAAKVLFAI